MKAVRWCLALVAATGLWAYEPRPKPADYPAHADVAGLTIAAEYTVHSFSNGQLMYYAPDYLIVEVALYPSAEGDYQIQQGMFSLRVNGRKYAIVPSPPGFAAASLRYSDWTSKPTVTAEAGDGVHGVTIGRQQRTNRFPGDPTESQTQLPPQPRAPETQSPTGERSAPPQRAWEAVAERALEEGTHHASVAGYLYFPWSGKAKNVHSLELLYNGPRGEAKLKLM